MRKIGHYTLAIHEIGMIPFFWVQPHDLHFIIANFIKLVEIIHLREDKVEVDKHLVMPGIIAQIGYLTGKMLEVFELEVAMVDRWVSQKVEQLYWEFEWMKNLHLLAFDFLLTFGCAFDLPGLWGLAMSEMLGEFFSLAEGDDMLWVCGFGGSGDLGKVDARLTLHGGYYIYSW